MFFSFLFFFFFSNQNLLPFFDQFRTIAKCLIGNCLHPGYYIVAKTMSFDSDCENEDENLDVQVEEDSTVAVTAAIQQQAPNFTAQAVFPNQEFRDLSLVDYLGAYVVLVFYPADHTFVCPVSRICYSVGETTWSTVISHMRLPRSRFCTSWDTL
jgi:AhpC/TSA family